MGVAKPKKFYTPAEYYELEAKAEYKSDYYNGEIFPHSEIGADGQFVAMAGGSVRHSLICSNLVGELRQRLKGTTCKAFESNVRLKIKATGLRCYSDVSIYCGPREHDEDDPTGQTLFNPSVVFEVLSPSPEGFDRGTKAFHYRQIESLRALVLMTQDGAHAEVQFRRADGGWSIRDYDGLDAVVSLPDVSVDLPLAEVYDAVDFTTDR